MNMPQCIYGIDFSGAKNAGHGIWMATGVVKEASLYIENCVRAGELPGSGNERDRCLSALMAFIKGARGAAFGLDFPFGLPRALVAEKSWRKFVLSFPDRYQGPELFRSACFSKAGGWELRRATDLETRTPFSPYNIRIYKQTYFGISRVLNPIVRENRAHVLPMQRLSVNGPWIIEICPASTLKRLRLYFAYKGGKARHREARWRILEGITRSGTVSINSPGLVKTLIQDRGGDALDSVIAAISTFHAFKNKVLFPKGQRDEYAIEGYVYVSLPAR